jgi:hypothetical protein
MLPIWFLFLVGSFAHALHFDTRAQPLPQERSLFFRSAASAAAQPLAQPTDILQHPKHSLPAPNTSVMHAMYKTCNPQNSVAWWMGLAGWAWRPGSPVQTSWHLSVVVPLRAVPRFSSSCPLRPDIEVGGVAVAGARVAGARVALRHRPTRLPAQTRLLASMPGKLNTQARTKLKINVRSLVLLCGCLRGR